MPHQLHPFTSMLVFFSFMLAQIQNLHEEQQQLQQQACVLFFFFCIAQKFQPLSRTP
jgi:hypothetical protein